MKKLVYTRTALASLEDILDWTIQTFGDAQAADYTDQLVNRLDALARGQPPRPRPCSALIQNKRDATGLSFYREGQHYLILRESADTLELVEVFHGRMNIEARLRNLQDSKNEEG